MSEVVTTPVGSGNGVAGSPKRVWRFGEGDGSMKELLGGKGAGLAEMTRAGLPVPPGFTITTETCLEFYRLGRRFPHGLDATIAGEVAGRERINGKKFG